ncbi:YqjF family protein [Sphaerisporangium dianthi]|uniref:YqjF family protein n=1 Tax=Sphaerisporangium dianthi TaxID=1436120 RepID=A0ABV9CEX9_9ACTN
MRTSWSPRVAVPVMYQRWTALTFIHWRYPPGEVQRLLPPGLTVETFDDAAYVGLVPFLMEGVRPPGVPALPWLSRFPETNVRTYVRDAGGRSGLWFFSLDAERLPAVIAARAGYRLPYYWSRMSVRVDGGRYAYRCERRMPGPAGARGDADVELGPPLTPDERDERTSFLTDRYRLFTVVAGRLVHAEVEHPPWPLHHAALTRLDEDLVRAAGLPAPGHEPLLHASPGVAVRIGRWRRPRPTPAGLH